MGIDYSLIKIVYKEPVPEALGHKISLVTYVVYSLYVAYLLEVPVLSFSDLIEINIMSMMSHQQEVQQEAQHHNVETHEDLVTGLLLALKRLYLYGYVTPRFAGWSLTEMFFDLPKYMESDNRQWNTKVSTYGTLGLTSGPRDLDARVQLVRTIDPGLIAKIYHFRNGLITFQPYTREQLLASNRERNRYRVKPVADIDAEVWIHRIHEIQHTTATPPARLPNYYATNPAASRPFSSTGRVHGDSGSGRGGSGRGGDGSHTTSTSASRPVHITVSDPTSSSVSEPAPAYYE